MYKKKERIENAEDKKKKKQINKEKQSVRAGTQRRRRGFGSIKRRLIDRSFTGRPATTLAGIRRPVIKREARTYKRLYYMEYNV